ncbi:type II secretion system protein GspL [Xanthomonas vesicatoria]|uniref:Type II secretion system protein L n=1 Tax=Xanthomonas vesicatoria ATCC 35937 TaxID=925775 RepID=F0BB20_9XANT|nr:type II secretion system protein GspL [Xanthomonas vesicatoria]APP76535.1 type II secretion system protein GspL [Xanthomonas vesicatoria ATCC 35937]EGD10439.1 Type II secretion system protein L [Xanthomonas vesicatoria ATCC 35937]KTF33860.1 type II secretion system protein L [Xanthomonas vesicatoria]MCC8597148.1 type II secretion system protein GspL [Xanthomonas vesicatoria]MCC8605525.1 type II secretion system protein GspL [Xanthomonas vesicatoria]
MSSTLVLLPADAATQPVIVCVDAHGQVLAPDVLNARPAQITHTVLVVPGVDVHLRWMTLPGRSVAQSLAAARLQLAEHLAGAAQALHVVIADHAASDGMRLVAAVDGAVMRQWLDRAAGLGIVPDAVVPDCLLLPDAAPDQPPTLLHWDGRWVLRGTRIACSLEPQLAQALVASLPVAPALPPESDPTHAIAQFARHAADAPLNLRQQDFAAPTQQRAQLSSRTRVWLLALLVLSPVCLMVAQGLRYEIGAQLLQRRSAQMMGKTVVTPGADNIRQTAASENVFAPQLAALFAAVEAVPGAELDALAYQQRGPLRVTLLHRDAAQLEHVTAQLSRAGWQVRAGVGQPRDDRLATALELEPPR